MKTATPEPIDIDLISVPEGRRPLDVEAVKRLADSIERIGLHTPLTVLSINDGERLDLVAGAHRLAAIKSLAWPSAPCFVIEGDEAEAEMWEIAENLHRADLTALQRDEQIARWIELSEAMQVSPQVVAKPKGGRPDGGVRRAAREIGVNREDARRAEKVAALSPEAKTVARETGLEKNRSALLEAARESTPQAQVTALQRRFVARTADAPLNDMEAREKQVAALMSAWNKASAEARQDFLARIDTPVMDRRFG
jgi:ParB family chromosome partitioning protein